MDEKYLEQAAALELAHREKALSLARARVQGTGRPDCMDCGEPIPPARRVAVPSSIRCVCCATLFERK